MPHIIISHLVKISEPSKRRILLTGALVVILAISIVIATVGTISAIKPTSVSVKNATQYVDRISTKNTTTEPKQEENVYRERSINVSRESLLTDFKNIAGRQTITGLHVSNIETNPYKGLEIIKRNSGKTPIVLTICMPKYSAGMDTWQSYIKEVISNWKDGHLLNMLWGHSSNPLGSMAVLSKGTDTDWEDIIKDGGELNKVWKDELDILAVYLKQLQTAGVVPILDILPYMNYKYALWSARPGLNGSIRLYQLTHDYLTMHHNLHSLMWAWSLEKNGDMEKLSDFWPGDQYVDVVVIYMWKTIELATNNYQNLLEVAKDKPIAMDGMESIPRLKLLSEQPRWTWFTIYDEFLIQAEETMTLNINATFNDQNVISRENCNFL